MQFLDGSLADMAYSPGELWQYEPGDGSSYPGGAWLGYQRSGGNLVLVVARSRDEARPCSARWSGWVTPTRMATAACRAFKEARRVSPTGRCGCAATTATAAGWSRASC